MFLFCELLYYYLIQSPRYDQVLTGVLPYNGDDCYKIVWDISSGARPSHPTDPNQNQWMPDRVWDVITTGWRHKPKHRCKLPVVGHVFSTSSQREVRNVTPGDFEHLIAETSQLLKTLKQGGSDLEKCSHG